ncbi:hypothetical protein GCM10009796_04360 [Microbacterium koreense]
MAMRTRRAAPTDHPASMSGLTNGPLEANARAEVSAMMSPDIERVAGTAVSRTIGRGAVDRLMAASGCQE